MKTIELEQSKIVREKVRRHVSRHALVPDWTQNGETCELCGWEIEDKGGMVIMAELDTARVMAFHPQCFDA